MKDLTTKAQRLNWFPSKFARTTWLDIATGVVITSIVSLMVANLAYFYGFR